MVYEIGRRKNCTSVSKGRLILLSILFLFTAAANGLNENEPGHGLSTSTKPPTSDSGYFCDQFSMFSWYSREHKVVIWPMQKPDVNYPPGHIFLYWAVTNSSTKFTMIQKDQFKLCHFQCTPKVIGSEWKTLWVADENKTLIGTKTFKPSLFFDSDFPWEVYEIIRNKKIYVEILDRDESNPNWSFLFRYYYDALDSPAKDTKKAMSSKTKDNLYVGKVDKNSKACKEKELCTTSIDFADFSLSSKPSVVYMMRDGIYQGMKSFNLDYCIKNEKECPNNFCEKVGRKCVLKKKKSDITMLEDKHYCIKNEKECPNTFCEKVGRKCVLKKKKSDIAMLEDKHDADTTNPSKEVKPDEYPRYVMIFVCAITLFIFFILYYKNLQVQEEEEKEVLIIMQV